jgi:hypothetical protein
MFTSSIGRESVAGCNFATCQVPALLFVHTLEPPLRNANPVAHLPLLDDLHSLHDVPKVRIDIAELRFRERLSVFRHA